MNAVRKEDRWIPVRNGAVYCSPGCGGKCTYAAYEKATSEALTLATRLGNGWSLRVWENLGWHWAVEHKLEGAQISAPAGRGGTYMFLTARSPQIHVEAATPESCVAKAKEAAREIAKRMQALGDTL